jgi:hypothetical protein
MLDRIPFELFEEWRRFYAVCPWGPEVEALGHAVVASTVAEVNRDRKRRARPFSPAEFMPLYRQQRRASYRPVTDPREWGRTASMMRSAFGGRRRGGRSVPD